LRARDNQRVARKGAALHALRLNNGNDQKALAERVGRWHWLQ
jgi:hypothetical protein